MGSYTRLALKHCIWLHCHESVLRFYNTARCFPYVEVMWYLHFNVKFGIIYKWVNVSTWYLKLLAKCSKLNLLPIVRMKCSCAWHICEAPFVGSKVVFLFFKILYKYIHIYFLWRSALEVFVTFNDISRWMCNNYLLRDTYRFK